MEPSVPRSGLQVMTHLEADQKDREYWWSRTPLERMQHLEALREMNYGPEVLNERLQRVLTVLERPRR